MSYEPGTEFCRRVTAQLRHVTSGEKAAIEEELMGHIEDRVEALTALKWPEEEAEQSAVAAMGDPEEVGRKLAKEYPLSWLVVGRIAAVLMVMLILPMLLGAVQIVQLGRGMAARVWPERWIPAAQIDVNCDEYWETDIRLEVGNDVIRVFGVGTRESKSGQLAYVAACSYDAMPFGIVNQRLLSTLKVSLPDGRRFLNGGSYVSTDRIHIWTLEDIPVMEDAEEVVLVYEKYGQYAEIRVPLVKEGSA